MGIDMSLVSWLLPRAQQSPVASFTKEVNLRLAKRPLKTNGRLANRRLTSLVKEATGKLSGEHVIWTTVKSYLSALELIFIRCWFSQSWHRSLQCLLLLIEIR